MDINIFAFVFSPSHLRKASWTIEQTFFDGCEGSVASEKARVEWIFRSEEGFGFGPISGYGVDTIIGLPPIYAVPAGCHFGCGEQEKRLRRLAVKYLQFLFNNKIMDALYLSANLKSSSVVSG
jgi:hypothetical protein